MAAFDERFVALRAKISSQLLSGALVVYFRSDI